MTVVHECIRYFLKYNFALNQTNKKVSVIKYVSVGWTNTTLSINSNSTIRWHEFQNISGPTTSSSCLNDLPHLRRHGPHKLKQNPKQLVSLLDLTVAQRDSLCLKVTPQMPIEAEDRQLRRNVHKSLDSLEPSGPWSAPAKLLRNLQSSNDSTVPYFILLQEELLKNQRWPWKPKSHRLHLRHPLGQTNTKKAEHPCHQKRLCRTQPNHAGLSWVQHKSGEPTLTTHHHRSKRGKHKTPRHSEKPSLYHLLQN